VTPATDVDAVLDSLDETTQVSGATPAEVDLDVEHDVEIEFDDAT
jgi:hypothetical protein